jgi:hypothetical protein
MLHRWSYRLLNALVNGFVYDRVNKFEFRLSEGGGGRLLLFNIVLLFRLTGPSNSISSENSLDFDILLFHHHHITEILLKVALNTITLSAFPQHKY